MKKLWWLLLAPVLLVVAWFIYTRHVPWKVPPEHQPPSSWAGEGLTLEFLGVSGYALSDGTTTVLLDPTPTRPDPVALITGKIASDPALVATCCAKADLILVNHPHYDHAMDVGEIALRTGAVVAGSQNTVNLALSRGVPKEKTRVLRAGDHLTVGGFEIDVRSTRHTDIGPFSQPMSGSIATDAKALWFWQYALDETLSYRLTANGTSVWFHPTSTYAAGELGGLPAKNLIVGVTGEKQTPEKIRGLLKESGARRVLPTHYDNFFQPMARGLALMPGCDLSAVKRLFLAEDPGLEWGVLDYGQVVVLPRD